MSQASRRTLWTTIHRYIGLSIMLFLLIAAVSGCILCFAPQLDRALNRDLFVVDGASSASDPLAKIERLSAARPDLQIVGFPLNNLPGATIPVEVMATPGGTAPGFDQVFLDPANGHIVGVREKRAGWDRRHIVEGIAQFHFTLLAGDAGRWFMGVMALAWLVGNLVGVYLTWPRKRPYLKNWRRMWRFSLKSVLGRLMLDIHRSTGLWLLIGVTALAYTSVCLNFYAEAYEPTVIRIAPLKRSLFDRPAPFPNGTRPALTFREAVALGKRQVARDGLKWKPATMLYRPDWNLYGMTLTNDGTLNYRALGPIYYYFDARGGALAHVVNPYDDSAGLVMIRMLYPLHSGQIGGWPTIAIVFLLGLATIEMIVTGFYVWWKKRASRLAAERSAAKRAAITKGI
ncbi:PepSY domain-containing protein [Sphingomonas sp. So64.6b]|uniref:PepSY-associated TM helix domain-containing protein n=1 Tax=Sphingomonas sp. So64.6b TaxID=2997354 RepID=UPI0015FEE799|nr:PepSY-associated TM helix domain-containing protein [Sphingomonas sp. So64.6b]QNA86290.1 PepSY domain-containing protein [Sphingomonas sp. So64.6b]